ncbi:MAG TPA: SH3 domain-containing protein [Coleofasciculaceae cyanobacterium]
MTIATSIFSFAPVAQAGRCRTIAQDWDGLVDVRSQPKQNIFNLIATVPNGTRLDVIGRRGDWLEIYAPDNRLGTNYQTGWVAEKQTRRICSRDRSRRDDRGYDRDDD